MKTAEGVEHQGIALLTQPLQRLGSRQWLMACRAVSQPEDRLPQQGFGAGDAIGFMPFQPDQAPFTGASESLTQEIHLGWDHEAELSPGFIRGSNIRSPI